jgi:hypothetical protein
MAYFHVMIWPRSKEQQRLHELYALNLSEEDLRERIIEPYGRDVRLRGADGRFLPATFPRSPSHRPITRSSTGLSSSTRPLSPAKT